MNRDQVSHLASSRDAFPRPFGTQPAEVQEL
jgi:hypothetical protein